MPSNGIGLPYITALNEHVDAEPWARCDSNGEAIEKVGDVFTDFDPGSSDRFVRNLTVNLSDLRSHCRLEPTDALLLTVVAWSKEARKRYQAYGPVRLKDDGDGVVALNLEAKIDGSCIAGEVALMTHIVIDAPIQTTDIFAASIPGSVLWRDEVTIEVEGNSAQFPISSGAFSEMPWIRSPKAAWHLDYDPAAELDMPFASVVRLYINSENKKMREYQRNPDIMQVLKYETARSLLGTYMVREDIVEYEPESDPRSLGSVLILMSRTLFQGWGIHDIAELIRHNPGQFESHIRAQVEVFHA